MPITSQVLKLRQRVTVLREKSLGSNSKDPEQDLLMTLERSPFEATEVPP
jgi:hypothetical protein